MKTEEIYKTLIKEVKDFNTQADVDLFLKDLTPMEILGLYGKIFDLEESSKKEEQSFIDIVNRIILWGKENISDFEENDLSDGYHTFNDLYEFRKQYNAALFNEWARQKMYDVHKSTKHYDGEDCFGGGWFIVIANLPAGQISNHYKMKDWELFNIPATEKCKFEFDGHSASDVIYRLEYLNMRDPGWIP